MALSRNERRKLSKLRALERAKRVQRAADNAAHVERMAIIQRNLRNGVPREYLTGASPLGGSKAAVMHTGKEMASSGWAKPNWKPDPKPRATPQPEAVQHTWKVVGATPRVTKCKPGKAKGVK
jgi:hypothetical protein